MVNPKPRKIFIGLVYFPYKKFLLEFLTTINKRHPIDECYVLVDRLYPYVPTQADVPEGVKLSTFDAFDLEYGMYKNVKWKGILPLDEQLLNDFAECEAESMVMMERNMPVEQFYPEYAAANAKKFNEVDKSLRINKHYAGKSLSYAERKRIYLRHLRFWNNFVENNRIDLFVWSHVPHVTYDYVIYSLAKRKHIPTVMLAQGAFLRFEKFEFLMHTDIGEQCLDVRDRLEELRKSGIDPEQVDLSEKCLKEWERLTAELDKQTSPGFIKRYARDRNNSELARKKTARKTRIRHILDGTIVKKIFSWDIFDIDRWHFRIKDLNNINKLEKRLNDFYESNTSPVREERFIYAPLHMQPEITTAPLAGRFVDQLLVIQLLAEALPPKVLIYVKENPFQTLTTRSAAYYQDLLDIPSVRLISRKANTYELLDKCIATATITGTAGWEGLFKQKPFIMFGSYVYQFAPGVYPVKNLAECKEAVEAILNGSKPTLGELKLFMKALDMSYLDVPPGLMENKEIVKLNEKNIQKLANAFIDKYEEAIKQNSI
ncbi:MAG: hypothetical protein IIA45_11085 [Bacteroidetes bacterium]|nr:hypothetical protein [Bacteroidota bacterium]